MLLLLSIVATVRAEPDFTGTYLQEVRLATATKVPVFGKTLVTTTSLVRLEVNPGAEPGSWLQTQHTCAVHMHSDSLIASTSTGPAFTAAITDVTYPVRFTPRDDGRYDYLADPGVTVAGYRATPHDAIPTDRDDPRIVDWDGDGHPAASLDIKVPVVGEVKVFIVQRGQTVFSGTWQDGAVADGRLTVPVMEQLTVGATAKLFDQTPRIFVREAESTFTISPVDPRSSCETIDAAWQARQPDKRGRR